VRYILESDYLQRSEEGLHLRRVDLGCLSSTDNALLLLLLLVNAMSPQKNEIGGRGRVEGEGENKGGREGRKEGEERTLSHMVLKKPSRWQRSA